MAAQLGNVNTAILSRAELAVVAMDRGRWGEAADHLRVALSTIDEHRLHDYSLSVLAFAAAARLAVQRGDRREADLQITRAMRTRPACSFALPWLAVRVRLQLAKALAANADERVGAASARGDRRHREPTAGPRRVGRGGVGTSAGR